MAASLWAQRAPVAPLGGGRGGDLTGSYSIFVKDTDLDMGYTGGAVSGTGYLTRHIGVRGEFEYSSMNKYDYTEKGIRGGLVYRLHPGQRVQPYLEVLGGYGSSKAKGFFVSVNKQINAPSLMGGAGLDYQLRGSWYLRLGADAVANIASKNGDGNKFARGIIGISYHFGGNQ